MWRRIRQQDSTPIDEELSEFVARRKRVLLPG
jgi:hypothetical protein